MIHRLATAFMCTLLQVTWTKHVEWSQAGWQAAT